MKAQVLALQSLALLAGFLAFGQEGPKPEHYAATWAVVGGVSGGTTVPIDVRINKFNTDAEINEYAALVASKGPEGLRRALEKQDVGQFSPVGKVGTPLAIARKVVQGDQTIVRVLTIRPISFAELRNGTRSVDYPYTMLEMVFDKDGKGTGTAIGAAKISFNKKKKIHEIESFQHGADYNKLLNVRLLSANG
jgi:hypothetical protein